LVVQLEDADGDIISVKLDSYKSGSYNYEAEVNNFVSFLTDTGGKYEGFNFVTGSGIIKTGPSYWDTDGNQLTRGEVQNLGYTFQSPQTVRVDDDSFKAGDVTNTPIAIDLDNDGSISYMNLDGDVDFDFGSGLLATAWVSPNDGLLVFDHESSLATSNARGFQPSPENIVLTLWADGAETDMEALALYFDTNQDAIFNSEDDHWYAFGVWQDLNSDGVIDDGEFQDLDYYGIVGFDLNYLDTSEAFTTADGAVEVYGQFTVIYDDGTTGVADDMAFIQTFITERDESPESVTGEPATPNEADPADYNDIGELIADYLEIVHSQDLDQQVTNVDAELAHALDELVSDYIELNGISIEEYASIQEDVLNAMDRGNNYGFDDDGGIHPNPDGTPDDGGLSALNSLETALPDVDLEAGTGESSLDSNYGDSDII
jgi:hypothetical protein